MVTYKRLSFYLSALVFDCRSFDRDSFSKKLKFSEGEGDIAWNSVEFSIFEDHISCIVPALNDDSIRPVVFPFFSSDFIGISQPD